MHWIQVNVIVWIYCITPYSKNKLVLMYIIEIIIKQSKEQQVHNF